MNAEVKQYKSPPPSLTTPSGKRIYVKPGFSIKKQSENQIISKTPLSQKSPSDYSQSNSPDYVPPSTGKRVTFAIEQVNAGSKSSSLIRKKQSMRLVYFVFGCFVTIIATLLTLFN